MVLHHAFKSFYKSWKKCLFVHVITIFFQFSENFKKTTFTQMIYI
jgi:hypothetical protein